MLAERIRQRIAEQSPELLNFYELYANEARFALTLLMPDLERLPQGARILEVGAGIGLLSCELQQRGYQVTSLEPIGTGFDYFHQLRELVLAYAASQGALPELLDHRIEELHAQSRFHLAFSLNVMEHVEDVQTSMQRIHAALLPEGWHRFCCPNYTFPYEPHFNFITLGSKERTARYLWNRIEGSARVPNAVQTWNSLNWISVKQIRRICDQQLGVNPEFSRDIFFAFAFRARTDPWFQERRSRWMRIVVSVLHLSGLLNLIYLIPLSFMPTIDCTVRRSPAQQASIS